MMQTTINRRRALAVVAAVPAAAALGSPAFATGEPGQLAALVRRYYDEVDAFNAIALATDEASDSLADATYNATMSKMIGVPARSADDALAAMDWLIREGADSMIELDPDGTAWAQTCVSLVNAVRDYIASTA